MTKRKRFVTIALTIIVLLVAVIAAIYILSLIHI